MSVAPRLLLVITHGMWDNFAQQIRDTRGERDIESGGYLYGVRKVTQGMSHVFIEDAKVFQESDYIWRNQIGFEPKLQPHLRMFTPVLNDRMPFLVHTHPVGQTLSFSPADQATNRKARQLVARLADNMPFGAGVLDHSLDPAQTHFVCLLPYGHVQGVDLCVVESEQLDALALWREKGNAIWDLATVHQPDAQRYSPYPYDPSAEEVVKVAIGELVRVASAIVSLTNFRD